MRSGANHLRRIPVSLGKMALLQLLQCCRAGLAHSLSCMTQTVDSKTARQASRRSRPRSPTAPALAGARRQHAARQESARAAPPTLVDLFAAQVAARPRAVALSLGPAHLSYAELDERAETLAARLAAMGAGPGAIVGLCLPGA